MCCWHRSRPPTIWRSLPVPDAVQIATPHGVLLLGRHAVERYVERVRPGLDLPQAVVELAGVLQCSTLAEKQPLWKAHSHWPPVAWLLIGEDIALPLQRTVTPGADWFVPTCMVKDGNAFHDAGTLGPGKRKIRKRRAPRRRVDA